MKKQKRGQNYFLPYTIFQKNNSDPVFQGFTLVELMIAFSIFMVIMALLMTVIVSGFRSFNQGQKIAQREQRKRFAFNRLSKEIASITSISYPAHYFSGEENSFFLSITRRTMS